MDRCVGVAANRVDHADGEARRMGDRSRNASGYHSDAYGGWEREEVEMMMLEGVPVPFSKERSDDYSGDSTEYSCDLCDYKFSTFLPIAYSGPEIYPEEEAFKKITRHLMLGHVNWRDHAKE